MKVLLTDRTGAVPEQAKADLARRLVGLSRHFDLVSEAEVEMDRDLKRSERPLHVVELTFRMIARRVRPIRAREAGRDLGEVLGTALDKVDRELVRLKERVTCHPTRTTPRPGRLPRRA